MANPSKRDSTARKVVAAARSIVTYQIGLPQGCVRVNRALHWLAPYETGLPTVFEDYLKEVRLLPIGSERLHWNRKVLKEKDIALEAANQKFRNRVFDACWTLIERFGEVDPALRAEVQGGDGEIYQRAQPSFVDRLKNKLRRKS